MNLICPKCGKSQDVNKDEMMGRYIVCRYCRYAFMWEKNLKQQNQNKDKPNPV
jgi:DNA-directed RNA polymerase subunit RPC12/RpoP